MGGDFASGKHANGTCDVCGFVYKLKELKPKVVNQITTNILACPTCWEPDHPQWQVGKIRVRDPQAVKNPRPDTPPGED